MRNQGGRALQATPIVQLVQCRDRAGRPRSPCAMIGREYGRSRSPLLDKYHSQHQHQREEKRKENKRQRERGGERKEDGLQNKGGFERERQGRTRSTKGEAA